MDARGGEEAGAGEWANGAGVEKDLRDSLSRMKAILDTAVDAIITIDERGSIESYNPAAERLFGYMADEVRGRNVNVLMPSPYHEEHDLYLARYLATGQKKIIGIGREVVARRKDGTLFPIDLAVSEVYLSDRRLFTGFVRDITERKHSERRIAAQLVITRTLAEAHSLAEATAGLLQAICEMFDWDLGVLWRLDPASMVLRHVRTWHQRPDAVAEFDSMSHDMTFQPGSGKPGEIWNTGSAACVADVLTEPSFQRHAVAERLGLQSWLGFPILSGGQVSGVIEVFGHHFRPVDQELLKVTASIGSQIGQFIERRLAEERLEEERERLAVTLRSIGDGVITTDVSGRVFLMNRTAEKLTGWTQSEAKQRPLSEVFRALDDKTREAGADPVQMVLREVGAAELHADSILVARNGRERRIDGIYAPLHDRKSRRIGVVIAFRDVTERHQMEQEILKADKLESIGVLAGGIAHDFNNFLGEILVNLDLAKMSLPPASESFPILTEAEKAALRAKDLTQQLLTFSKGGAPIKQLMALQSLIRDSVRFALSGSNVRCEFSLPDGLWPAEVDGGQIGQVIDNLVLNAVQAMPSGGTVRVVAENVGLSPENRYALSAGRYVKLSIADQGPGIPADHVERIFDPYFTTKEGGSGLGLATSYSIVKRHEGHITVESERGGGATFHVLLPASASDTPEPVARTEHELHGKGHVLLMEDSEGLRVATTKILIRLGYTVEGARDGETAIRLYTAALASPTPFDAVIMDLTISGGMGGKETIQHLRKIDPDVRAIAASGYSTDPIMAHFRDYGFVGVIAKPFGRTDLGKVLEGVIGPGA